jgi:hypothetical protein
MQDMPESDTMGDNADSMQDYQKARADFDARWQAALSPPEPSEIRFGEPLTQDAMLERMLTRIRELASASAERGLIEPQGRDAIHAAVDEITAAFAGIARKDLADVMRSISSQLPTPTSQAPPNP